MTEYDNTNRGAIWPNDRMRDGKKDPEFTGSLNVNGVEYWVSAWKRKPDAKPGAPSLSFSVRAKDERSSQPSNTGQESRAEPARGPGSDDAFDDEPPF